MAKILIVSGSVTPKEKSISNELLNRFIQIYKENNSQDELHFLDLNEESAGNNTLNISNFSTFWNEENGLKYIKQLKSVDKLIIVAPMYNFNVSGLIKNYIDHIALANQTFSYKYSKKGDAVGLLNNLKVQIISSQGAPKGWYTWGDHVAYLEGTWKFMGAELNDSILLSGVKTFPLNEKTPAEMVDTIIDEIYKSAKSF